MNRRKIIEIVESVKEDYLLNTLEEGTVNEITLLKTKKFLNETANLVERILVEEGLADSVKGYVSKAMPALAAGAAGAAGAFGYDHAGQIADQVGQVADQAGQTINGVVDQAGQYADQASQAIQAKYDELVQYLTSQGMDPQQAAKAAASQVGGAAAAGAQ